MKQIKDFILKSERQKLFIPIVLLLITSVATCQVKVANNGFVGIGGINPAYNLDVKGKVRFSLYGEGWEDIFLDNQNVWSAPQLYCKTANFSIGTNSYPVNSTYVNHLYVKYTYAYSSDDRLKENIKPLGKTLSKLMEVKSKTYNYKKDEETKNINGSEKLIEKETFGFIAQDLEKIFPELVYAPSEMNEYYYINYIGMIPVLVEAIKEQQEQITNLEAIVYKQASELFILKENIYDEDVQLKNSSNNDINGQEDSENYKNAKLLQNAPNPFFLSTEIKFEIPENFTSAKLIIYNMQGIEIKSFNIATKGVGNIIIQGSELSAGMYLYTLLVNNRVIDTKKMILTK
ncbi:MAG: tail fiber domain-containing protein [Bacteroidales bacterium]|jgi:hypothetical protein|nr:tail fiber domain-containing protein [Bacteroidales bacterium]